MQILLNEDRKELITSVFIGVYVYAALVASNPHISSVSAAYNQVLLKPLSPVIFYLGLEQDINAYSYPEKIAVPNIRPLIIFDDGTSKYGERLSIEKSLCWTQVVFSLIEVGPDCLGVERRLWEDLARFTARKYDTERCHPVTVIMQQCWEGLNGLKPALQVKASDTTVQGSMIYKVMPEDLTERHCENTSVNIATY